MAVTVTVADLLNELRLGPSTFEADMAARILAYATEAVTHHAPDAPDAVHNEAAIRLAAYQWDKPTAGKGDAYANGLRNSGAANALFPYRQHRAGLYDAS